MSIPGLEIQFKVAVNIQKDDEISAWVAVCSQLDVWSQGKTKKEALKNIKEAVNMFLVSCFERGTLGKVFKECGVIPSKTKRKPKKTSLKTHNIAIPIPFDVIATTGRTSCHA